MVEVPCNIRFQCSNPLSGLSNVIFSTMSATNPAPPGRAKRKSLAQKQAKKTERHVLDNPFKIRWPRHQDSVIESALVTVKNHVCTRYSAACSEDMSLSDVRGKRNFGHRLEKDRELIFSINCVTKLFEQEFDFQAVLVEESLIPTRIFDHVLYLCGLRDVPLVKGQVSVYLSSCLGRRKVAIVGVPATTDVKLKDLVVPTLPFANMEKLPELIVRIEDLTPSAEAVKRKKRKQEAKEKKSAEMKLKKMEVD